MSSMKRISAGTGANLVNLVYLMVVTGLTVPVLVHAWGVERYGIWIMLTAIPSYLTLSDFGFSTAATNDIAMHVARNAKAEATKVLHSVWALNLAVSAVAVMALGVVLVGLAALDLAVTNPVIQYNGTILLLALYALASMASRTVLGVYRASGRYATGTLLYDSLQFLEGCASLAVAWAGGGFAAAAATLLIGRLINLAVLAGILRAVLPELPLGIRFADRITLQRLLKPAAASMAIPISQALNMQGVAIVVGTFVSPTATAILSAARTVSRIAVQVISAVNRAMVPELSAASARGDENARQRILKLNTLMLAGFAAPAAVGFALLGPWAIGLWTAGAIKPSHSVVGLLALAMFLHCIWFFGTNLLSATNAHGRMTFGVLGSSVVAIGLAMALSHPWGLTGACVAVALGELICVLWFIYVQRTVSNGGVERPESHASA
ncbi:hypothetical protein GVN24_29950 [Rhizobium sp. CRIBSB]|nr:hypothetical protein [Rhizobium sp. CRIBSB]